MKTKNNPIARVYSYYWLHLNELPVYQQLHFAHRLLAVRNDKKAQQFFADFDLPKNDSAKVYAALSEALTNPQAFDPNAEYALYLAKYPKIRDYFRDIFIVRFAKQAFNLELATHFPHLENEMLATHAQLMSDLDSLKRLGCFATNFLIMSDYYLGTNKNRNQSLSSQLYSVYTEIFSELQNPLEMTQYFYILSHLLICDAQFYTAPLPAELRLTHITIFETMEKLLEKYYFESNLDMKCEFLVCAKLLGETSKLSPIIYNEVLHSNSNEGDFFIDRFTSQPQTYRTSFAESEHRSVMALLAFYESAIIP